MIDTNESGRFARDTGVERVAPGDYRVRIDRGWWILAGPNGGYVAALVLRALEDTVGSADRHVRSLTLHFLRPPKEGAATVRARVDRQGRTLSTASAELVQDGRLLVKAIGAFALRRDAPEFCDLSPPELPPPERCPLLREKFPHVVELQKRYETRWAYGELFAASESRAECAAWIRLASPALPDAPLVAAWTDSLPPAVLTRKVDGRINGTVPTIDLTIHFRAELPLPNLDADAFYALRFSTRVSTHGFIEEDGELWTLGGQLVAQSRQLALVG